LRFKLQFIRLFWIFEEISPLSFFLYAPEGRACKLENVLLRLFCSSLTLTCPLLRWPPGERMLRLAVIDLGLIILPEVILVIALPLTPAKAPEFYDSQLSLGAVDRIAYWTRLEGENAVEAVEFIPALLKSDMVLLNWEFLLFLGIIMFEEVFGLKF
jgi:hypothetical protein